MTIPHRIIGRYRASVTGGPLVVVIGGIHGNEPAGIHAAQRVLTELFAYRSASGAQIDTAGGMLALRGNLRAASAQRRFLDYDLNRGLEATRLAAIRRNGPNTAEDQELVELLELIEEEIKRYTPDRLIVLDLHTTTASGGHFSIVLDQQEALQLARHLDGPVVTGLAERLQGTTLHYFTATNTGLPTLALVYESGQHQEPRAVDRAVCALKKILAYYRIFQADDTPCKLSKCSPVMRFSYRYAIDPTCNFRMRPGYQNFQEIRAGEHLADDCHGPVRAQHDGQILMPLYQQQGDEGFFVLVPVGKLS